MTYDSSDRLTNITDSAPLCAFALNSNSCAYDDLGQVTKDRKYSASVAVDQSFGYGYDDRTSRLRDETKHGYDDRDYSANLNRWLSRDPIEEMGGVNLYHFVYNDPISTIDIIGLQQASSSTTQPGACACGPDITDSLKTMLNTLEATFKSWSYTKKAAAMKIMKRGGKDPETGTISYLNAWDIYDLANWNLSKPGNNWLSKSPYEGCATGKDCEYTVEVDGKCYYAGSVNYIIFGKMMRLLREEFPNGHPIYKDFLTPTQFTMNTLISAHKGEIRNILKNTIRAIKNDPNDPIKNEVSENYKDSKSWAGAGYNGWPNVASPEPNEKYKKCKSCDKKCTKTFTAYWFPNGDI